jgi:hypothetical protein
MKQGIGNRKKPVGIELAAGSAPVSIVRWMVSPPAGE